MKGFRFLNFEVYQNAKQLRADLLPVLSKLQIEKLFDSKNQLDRSSMSVILNIAEGSSRKYKNDFRRFLEISLGSLNEVVAIIDLLKECSLVTQEYFETTLETAESIAKQLAGLIKHCNNKNHH